MYHTGVGCWCSCVVDAIGDYKMEIYYALRVKESTLGMKYSLDDLIGSRTVNMFVACESRIVAET